MFDHVAVAFGIDVGPVFFLDYDNLRAGIQQRVCVCIPIHAVYPFLIWKHRDLPQLREILLQNHYNFTPQSIFYRVYLFILL